MALIFPRLAHNFIKNGYYPTDTQTLEGIASMLDSADGPIRLFDPCCGEGTALDYLREHLANLGADVETWGVEFDEERAWHAKQLLTRVIHSDVHDVAIKSSSVSLLFLNPPYGDAVSDKALISEKGADRLEKIFFRATSRTLAIDGVLVLIVPHYVVDNELAGYLARGFRDVRFFMAPEQQFKQCVIFGIRQRSSRTDPRVKEYLLASARGEIEVPTLTPDPTEAPYSIPASPPETKFSATRLDIRQFSDEMSRLNKQTLWPLFQNRFAQTGLPARRPLKALGRWHLALALAAGQIAGIVEADGLRLLIKGDTTKARDRSVETHEDGDGNITEVVTFTDRFVPTIRGIDLTPGCNFGAIVTIK